MKPSDNAVPHVHHGAQARLQPGTVAPGTLQCLVASASQTRRNLLTQAAGDAGWEQVICTTPADVLSQFGQHRVQFAMIDLDDRGGTPEGAREVVQTLAQDSSRVLLGVCGHEADPEEEIWVRQLGIWLYLPGVTTSTEVGLLCEQALQVITKRADEQVPHR